MIQHFTRSAARAAAVLLGVSIAAGACGSDGGTSTTDTAAVDAAGDASTADTGAPPAEANIEAALDCGTPLRVSGAAGAGELQLHEVDTALFTRAASAGTSRTPPGPRPSAATAATSCATT